MIKHLSPYKIAIFISTLSLFFGIFREVMIVGLFGFTSKNDDLQLYLSIFYTIGLSIDAVRLSCLNLYNILSLSKLLFAVSLIGLPFSICIGLIMSYATDGLNISMLSLSIIGSYLNLIAAVLVTYKQRSNVFLAAQFIYVMPNFILIPGILLCYWWLPNNLVFSIVCLTGIIPIAQCILLLLLPNKAPLLAPTQSMSFLVSLVTFGRHFASMIGEQLFQIITRTVFFNYGPGFLSLFAITVRIYSAARFILIDSFIGSKLGHWQDQQSPNDTSYFSTLINSTSIYVLIASIAFVITLYPQVDLLYSSIQVISILILGFYFSTLVRVVYFKINRYENNSILVTRFAIYELICALLAFLVAKQLNSPILTILWIGYIAKPLAQLLLLRKKYYELEIVQNQG